jgi:mono/diheme cytochrome c family protein
VPQRVSRENLTKLPALHAILLGGAALLIAVSAGAAPADTERGAYLFKAAGCAVCHTDSEHGGPALAGGRALKTDYGTFYTPNISPDPKFGIGAWSDADFINALRKGVSPGGKDYYPVFPYPAFTQLSDADIRDIKAYLFTLTPVPKPNRAHDINFPFSFRLALIPWKILYFREGVFQGDPKRSMEWNRGAYLANAVVHCGECHTPRNALGALIKGQRFGGVVGGPDGMNAPDITPDPKALGPWSTEDIETLLKDGITPDGDFVGRGMRDVVADTAALSDSDRHAIALYLKALPPLPPPPKPAR